MWPEERFLMHISFRNDEQQNESSMSWRVRQHSRRQSGLLRVVSVKTQTTSVTTDGEGFIKGPPNALHKWNALLIWLLVCRMEDDPWSLGCEWFPWRQRHQCDDSSIHKGWIQKMFIRVTDVQRMRTWSRPSCSLCTWRSVYTGVSLLGVTRGPPCRRWMGWEFPSKWP